VKKQNPQRGYAFLIVAIAIFVVAMLGITVLAEYSIKSAQRKTDSTRLARVYRAIVGDPSTDTFGYLGDVGDYPTTLQDLSQSPGATGWNGPYLSEDLINGSTVNDSFGSPMEYYLSLTAGSPDELAIISKGPDHGSSNTASNPNDRTQFTLPAPSSGSTYTNATGNADNLAYPDFSVSPSTAVDYQNTGTLTYNIVNKDANQANAIVDACPLVYSLVATSRARGSSDTITLPYSPGLSTDFLQGLWDISITSIVAKSAYFAESVAVYPGRTITHRVRTEDLDSSKTPTFALTINNNTGVKIDVYRFTTKIVTGIAVGAQGASGGTPNACANMAIKNNSTNAVLDTWVMPYANYTRTSSSTKSTLTVTNANTTGASHRQILVYRDGLLLGTVYQRKTVAFPGIDSGATIVVKDQIGGTVDAGFAMPASNTSKTYN
jgi:hypothetical protein